MSSKEKDEGKGRSYQSGSKKRQKQRENKLVQAGSDAKQRKISFTSPTPSASPSPSPVPSLSVAFSPPMPPPPTTPSPSPCSDVDITARNGDGGSLNSAEVEVDDEKGRTSSVCGVVDLSMDDHSWYTDGSCTPIEDHRRPLSLSSSTRSVSPPFSHSFVCSVEIGDPSGDQVEDTFPNLGLENETNRIGGEDLFASFGNSNHTLSEEEKGFLMDMHPVQPTSKPGLIVNLPFEKDKVYFQGNGGEKRLWLSYCANRRALFCWVCHGFGERKSAFATCGWGSEAQWRSGHCYKSIIKHELSVHHLSAVNAFLAFSQKRSVQQVLAAENMSLRARQVANNREVVLRIINIVLHLAKQAVAFRGNKYEAAYTLNSSCNHGNFLEEVKSRSVFDTVLSAHLEKVIKKSEKRHVANPESRGRGSLTTFLSKNTFAKILEIVANMILQKIREEIAKNGGKFSFSMDGCQDISVKEQMATVIRYVDEYGPVERLIDITALSSTASESLIKHAVKALSEVAIIGDMVGFSFDGAGNMSGIKTGLQARLKELVPDSIYQHCYSHVLNLALEKSCNCVLEAVTFFDLMRETASAISESYKRTDLWANVCEIFMEKTRMLVKQNKTRWWSKAKGLRRIFSEDEVSLLPTILIVLEIVSNDNDIPARPRAKYAGLLKKWCAFDTLAVGMLFHNIFSHTQGVSDYLQSPQLDHVQAGRLVSKLVPAVSSIDLEDVLTKAKLLSEKCNKELEELNDNSDFLEKFKRVNSRVQTECGSRRVSTVPSRHGDRSVSVDEARQIAEQASSPNYMLKIKTLIPVKDRCLMELRSRFNDESLTLFKSCSFLSPHNFEEIQKGGIPEGALDRLCKLAGADRGMVVRELMEFSKCYDILQKNIQADFPEDDSFVDVDFQEYQDNEEEIEEESIGGGNADRQESCKGCLRCPYRILRKHNLYTSVFRELTKVYKVALTLPCTQVTCERCFSRLKIIKSRLRNRMEEDYLQWCMLISVEREIVDSFDLIDILNIYANSSNELRRLLVL